MTDFKSKRPRRTAVQDQDTDEAVSPSGSSMVMSRSGEWMAAGRASPRRNRRTVPLSFRMTIVIDPARSLVMRMTSGTRTSNDSRRLGSQRASASARAARAVMMKPAVQPASGVAKNRVADGTKAAAVQMSNLDEGTIIAVRSAFVIVPAPPRRRSIPPAQTPP